MSRLLISLIIACFLPITAVAQVFIEDFEAIEKEDTMLVGIFRESDAPRLEQLKRELFDLENKQAQTERAAENKELLPQYSEDASNEKVAALEKQRNDALKALDGLAAIYPAEQVAKMKADINKQFDDMIAALPDTYRKASQDIKEQNKSLKSYDASEFSYDKKYDIKRRIASLAVGGKLYNYSRSRKFCHGRAAVARKVYNPENGATTHYWGFIDETGRVVVPFEYSNVFDFYNRSQAGGVFTDRGDSDSQGWTTVRRQDGTMGMIDIDGRMRIPMKFLMRKQYPRIFFYETPWGEFAQVCDAVTEKYGIIDRKGNYTMQPTETNVILWYTDVKCFGYRTEEGKLVTFDPYGKPVTVSVK